MLLQECITNPESFIDFKESLMLLQAAIDSANDGIIAIDQLGENLIYNKKCLKIWDIPKTLLSKPFTIKLFYHLCKKLDQPKSLIKVLQRLKANPKLYESQIVRLKNGKVLEVSTQPLFFNQKNIGRNWSFRDITKWVNTEQSLRQKTEKEHLISIILQRIRRSLDLQEILQTTVTEVRNFLETDRVLIYQFNPDWSGKIIMESVGSPWMPTLGMNICDPCFGEVYTPKYRQGRIHTVTDIYQDELKACYVEFLAQFQIRANLVIPILQNDKLWGLLLAHHCRKARQWNASEIQLLKDLANQVAIAIQQAELFRKLEQANQKLQRLASIDELTQLANRRHFDEYLQNEWRRMRRDKLPLALILCDVDYFKSYNDTYGHQAGDDCLQEVAKVLKTVVKRSGDLVARYGGEEFAVILPNTPAKGTVQLAEAIRSHLRQKQLIHPQSSISPYVTLSLGVGVIIPNFEKSPDDLIMMADQALYCAKDEGRDRVVLLQ